MASIRKKSYKNKKGVTITKYYICYRDIMGKQKSGGGYRTLQEAKKHLNDFTDITSADSDLRLKDIFNLFKKKCEKYAQTTQNLYTMYYNKYFKPIEEVKYKKLNTIFLQNLFDEIEKDSPYVAVICLKMWKSATNTAIKKKLIPENKFNSIDPIKLPKADINHLTSDRIIKLLEIAKKEYCKKYYTMLYLMVGTGMREGEILALQKEDFNYKERTISVNKQYTHGELKQKPKTDSSIRTVYLFPDLAEAIQEYIKELEGNILFPNMNGGYINIDNFRRRFWTQLKKKAGITERIRLHDLRGSYIDLILSSGLSAKFAQSQVGHAKIQTTLDIYAQNNKDMVEKAEEKINKILGEKCWKSVEKNTKNKKSNILQFRKKSDITAF